VAEHEPNNDSRTAQVVTGPSEIHGSFSPGVQPDEDWYRVDVSTPTILKLDFSAPVEATLEVQDSQHNRLVRASAGAGNPIVLPDLLCKAGCYVRLAAGKKEASGDYTLNVSLSAPTPRSEIEPNNRFVDAQPLAPGAAIDGHIATPDDEDWYQIDTSKIPATQMLAIAIASPPDVRLDLAIVRGSDQAPIGAYKAVEAGDDLHLPDLALPVAPETNLFLVVKSAYVVGVGGKAKRIANPNVAYTIELQSVMMPPGIEREPNEDAMHATALDLTQPVHQGFLSPKSDVDWYLLHVNAASILRAEVSGVENVKTVLALIDPAKKDEEKDNELVKVDSGDVKEPQVMAGVALPAGDNYLRIEGALKKIDHHWVRDYVNDKQPYTLTLAVDPDDGTWEHEPNDKPDRATPVEIGKEYKGYLWPAGDVDVWRLEVKQPATVAIVVSPVPKVTFKVSVRDAQKDGAEGKAAVVGILDGSRVESEARLVVPFAPGSYDIEISDKTHTGNNQKPYVLSLK
jgi:hypothetical protein